MLPVRRSHRYRRKATLPVALTDKPIKTNYYSVKMPWEEVILKSKMPYLQRLRTTVYLHSTKGCTRFRLRLRIPHRTFFSAIPRGDVL
jgi:hypothetical protein